MLIMQSLEATLEQDSDRKKSAEQRATSILTGSAVALTLMFTVTTIALNLKTEIIDQLKQSTTLSMLVCLGVVLLLFSNVFFAVAVWRAAHTLRPRSIMNYRSDSYRDLRDGTRKTFLIDKVESLSKCAKEWDVSAASAVEDLNRTLSSYKTALTFLFLTTVTLASALLLFVIPWLINQVTDH